MPQVRTSRCPVFSSQPRTLTFTCAANRTLPTQEFWANVPYSVSTLPSSSLARPSDRHRGPAACGQCSSDAEVRLTCRFRPSGLLTASTPSLRRVQTSQNNHPLSTHTTHTPMRASVHTSAPPTCNAPHSYALLFPSRPGCGFSQPLHPPSDKCKLPSEDTPSAHTHSYIHLHPCAGVCVRASPHAYVCASLFFPRRPDKNPASAPISSPKLSCVGKKAAVCVCVFLPARVCACARMCVFRLGSESFLP